MGDREEEHEIHHLENLDQGNTRTHREEDSDESCTLKSRLGNISYIVQFFVEIRIVVNSRDYNIVQKIVVLSLFGLESILRIELWLSAHVLAVKNVNGSLRGVVVAYELFVRVDQVQDSVLYLV